MYEQITLVASGKEPWFYYTKQNNNYCYGIQCNLINYLARSLNFTYNVIIDTNGKGFQLPNNSWSGKIGKLFSNVCQSILFNIQV